MKRNTIFTALFIIIACSVGALAQGGKSASVTIVRDADQPAKQPFAKFAHTNFSDMVTVPAGKVLVVESVSGSVSSAFGEVAPITIYVLDYNNPGDSIKQVHVFAPTHQTANHKTFYTHQTRLYVPAGHTVYMFWLGDAAPVAYNANISGYFVDVP